MPRVVYRLMFNVDGPLLLFQSSTSFQTHHYGPIDPQVTDYVLHMQSLQKEYRKVRCCIVFLSYSQSPMGDMSGDIFTKVARDVSKKNFARVKIWGNCIKFECCYLTGFDPVNPP